MTRHNLTPSRRTVLKTGTAAALLGGIGLTFHVDTAEATVTSDFSVPDAEFTDADGQPAGIWLYASGAWSYRVDREPAEIALALYLRDTGDQFHLIDVTERETTATAATGEFDLGGDILATDAYDPSDFTAPGPGQSMTRTVEVGVLLRVVDANGDLITDGRATTLVDIMVTQSSVTAEIGGRGTVAFQNDSGEPTPTPPP